jgi:hypothetical protein
MRSPYSSNDRKVMSKYQHLLIGQQPSRQQQTKSGWWDRLGRALGDNSALIAALIALGGVIYSQLVTIANTQAGLAAQRELEDEGAREAELQTYFDDMGQMLLGEDKSLAEADRSDPISTLARAKTLTILERLDGPRQKIVLHFVAESRLINKGEPVISLAGANLTNTDLSSIRLANSDLSDVWLTNTDLSRADLRETNLSESYLSNVSLSYASLRNADLSNTNLSNTNLSNTNLSEANLNEANLSEANLSGANLRKTDLREADLSEVNLSRANLSDADLNKADLSDATGVTDEQLAQAKTLEGATMPDGSTHD